MDWGSIFQNATQAAFGPEAIVFCLAAIGLNIHFGYTGLLNFGQAGFMAVGGYAVGTIVATADLSFWFGVLVAFVASTILTLLLGVPTLRLRADYLAILTLAAAEIIRLVVGSSQNPMRDWFGGKDGRQDFVDDFRALNPLNGSVDLGFVEFSRNDAWVAIVGWCLVGLACLLVWALMRSPW